MIKRIRNHIIMISNEDLENYLISLEIDGRSPITIKNYQTFIKPFIKYSQENKLTMDNCQEILEKYKIHLKKNHNYNNNSLKTAITVNKIFLTNKGYPVQNVKIPYTGKTHPQYLTQKETQELLKAHTPSL